MGMSTKKLIQMRQTAIAFFLSVSAVFLFWLISPSLSATQPLQVQHFDRIWETVRDRFYDPQFKGKDWSALKEQYRPQVQQAKSPEETSRIVNQMLAELQTSHTYYYTPDNPAYYQIWAIFAPRLPELQENLKQYFPNGKIEYPGIGIFTQDQGGKTFISSLVEGSPAATAGLQIGDRILNVDGRPFHPLHSFEGQVGEAVNIRIERSPNSQQEIRVIPKRFDASTQFLDAQNASIQILERQGKKLGYIHMWSYANAQYQQKLEEELLYGRLRQADGLILDLRDGWGGSPTTVLNIYTGRGPSLTNITRDGKRYTNVSTWEKPVVMIVNEGSRSAKEVLAYGFQAYNIGPVVGTKTAGAVVAGRPFLMSDGSLLYLAVADVYVDGDTRLEGVGVTPDIEVPFSLPYAQGADPQKETALQVLLQEIQQS